MRLRNILLVILIHHALIADVSVKEKYAPQKKWETKVGNAVIWFVQDLLKMPQRVRVIAPQKDAAAMEFAMLARIALVVPKIVGGR